MARITAIYDIQNGSNVNMSSYNRMKEWWGNFRKGGDIDKPTWTINKITFKHSHSATNSAQYWALAGRIVLADANATTFTSPFVSQRISGSVVNYTNVFLPETTSCSDGSYRLPTKEEFDMISNIQVIWQGNNDSYACVNNNSTLYWWIGHYGGSSFWWQIDVDFDDTPLTNYKPVIHTFNIWRSDNTGTEDEVEGTYAFAQIGCSMTDTSDVDDTSITSLRLYYAEEVPPDPLDPMADYIDLTPVRNYLTPQDPVPTYVLMQVGTTWSLGSMYFFTLVFKCGEEKAAIQEGIIPRAHVPIHIADFKTGGVAIGKYSSSVNGNPKFECAYPIFINENASYGSTLPQTGEKGQLFFLVP